LAIEALLVGMKVLVAAHLRAVDTASVDVHWGMGRKERHGGRAVSWVDVKREDAKQPHTFGLRLELIAEV
jgi:hypothetical protein